MIGRRMWLIAGAGLPLALLAVLVCLPECRADDTDPEPQPSFPSTTFLHRRRAVNNLKMIGLAFHNYHDANGAMPDAATYRDKNGKPLLSWRVALLPYLEEDKLYREFKLDEPWDSDHNKKLLAKMPAAYAPTILGKPRKPNTTYYRVFTGPDTPFNPKNARGQNPSLGIKLTDMTDGTSNTALVVEAFEPVTWTKPDELVYDAKKAIPKLGGVFKDGFHVVLGDGSVRLIGRKADPVQLRRLINPSDGEILDWKELSKK